MKTPFVSCLLLLITTALPLPALSTADLAIEDAARNTYNLRTVLDRRVRVKAYDGHVTLYGSVLDDEARRLAVSTVESLPGVTGVTSEMHLEGRIEEHSDAWMAAKIRTLLLARAGVSAFNTSITVRGSVAILVGTAPTQAQKELTALYAAEITGVKNVTNNIRVQPYAVALEQIDDPSISGQVKTALLLDPATANAQVQVTTERGTVRLVGEADSAAQIASVTERARTIRGAAVVTNELTVRQ